MDIQVFFGLPLPSVFGRIHFATLPDDVGNYAPYKGFRFEHRKTAVHSSEAQVYKFPGYVTRKEQFHVHEDLVIGFKNLHFDLWIASPKWYSPLFSVHYYYHVLKNRVWFKELFKDIKDLKDKTCLYDLIWKGIRIPGLLDILHSKKFDKKLAVASRERKSEPEGLGALFA